MSEAGDEFSAQCHVWAQRKSWLRARQVKGAVRPLEGDAILVLKKPYVDAIIAGEKTLEIRRTRMKAGVRWLASQGMVHGVAEFGAAEVVASDQEWQACMPHHMWDVPKRPYAACTYKHEVRGPVRIAPIPYQRLRGQIGFAKYRPLRAAAP